MQRTGWTIPNPQDRLTIGNLQFSLSAERPATCRRFVKLLKSIRPIAWGIPHPLTRPIIVRCKQLINLDAKSVRDRENVTNLNDPSAIKHRT